ncbi:carbohydrate ABC transporter permease [Floricoccus penangensis]|uniref:Glycerol-3-phosphate ABC transporter permease n=1 Tax=Floricoccus penangensis TaxID=1859475 RepID=A0A9Q5NZ68_9LACT|nr:sugar ABC transporter permease [Floricoccus penangensis]OFI46246.1 glycerol-3-phosphate ABC transporter permease [Floricoccus penangensis]URZ86968.1 sugar ABC transporter permease [Floricoccus penangensis]
MKIKNKDLKQATLFLGPSLILFGLFVFYPMIKTIYTSLFLTNTAGINISFVGLENYFTAFSSSVFKSGFLATIFFVLLTVPLTIFFGFILAYLTSTKMKGIGIFRLIFSSTMGISVAASSIFWLFLFNPINGYLNKFLGLFNIAPIGWLTDPKWAIISLAIATTWMNSGFAYIIFLGGIQSLDNSLLEAAAIQGVKPLYLIRKVILPLLSPTFYFVTTVSIIQAFQAFGQIDMLTKGGPNNATNTLVYQVYQDAFINLNSGRASAEAVVLFIVILIITLIQTKFSESKVHYQ